ncbi:hypothetical protein D3C80_1716000 [compost metagenome]
MAAGAVQRTKSDRQLTAPTGVETGHADRSKAAPIKPIERLIASPPGTWRAQSASSVFSPTMTLGHGPVLPVTVVWI